MKYFCNKLKEIFVKSLTEAKEKLNSKNIVKLVERKYSFKSGDPFLYWR